MKQMIKYIEDNLVFNINNECYAYYELLSYNYSFLSEEQKLILFENFEQLVNQLNSNIHLLQLSSEQKISNIAEQSKELIKGNLKDIAIKRIDKQVELLNKQVGDTQIDYRFFIGIKIDNEDDKELANIVKEVASTIKQFIYDVNNKMMEDFVRIDNNKLNRCFNLESLLSSKLSRRFTIKKLTEVDIAYIIEHHHEKTSTTYDDYEHILNNYEYDGKKYLKKYDLIELSATDIIEYPKYLKLENDTKTKYVSYMTISNITSELSYPGSEIFYYQQQFSFGIDTSINVEVLRNKKALSVIRNKKKDLKDSEDHAYQNNTETSNSVYNSYNDIKDLEDELETTKNALYKVSYVIRISANSVDELKSKCDEVKDFYDDFNIKLVRPFGNMADFHNEFNLASKRQIDDYIQYVKSDFLACLGFGSTQTVGDSKGIYIGYNVDTGKNVYIQPNLAVQGVKGSVTNTLSALFTGSLGGGKSFFNNYLIYFAVLFGAKAFILDPKSERGNWKRDLPEIADEINIVNLTSLKSNQGLLDPYVILKDLKDSESLAIDILTFLTGISSRDGEKFPVLRKAIRNVTLSNERGLIRVIDELRKENTTISNNIAEHIESFVDYDFALLLFSDGRSKTSITADKSLNILQIQDLLLPEATTPIEDYSTQEILSIAMMIVITTYSLDFIKMDSSIFKIVDIEEAWSFLQVAQGKALSMKLTRTGRSLQSAIYIVTQNTKDVDDEKMKNNIGMKFAFRSTEIEEIKDTLRFFNLDENDEFNQKRLRTLENGQMLFQDIYGRTAVVYIDYLFDDLFKAFDTRPKIEEETELTNSLNIVERVESYEKEVYNN